MQSSSSKHHRQFFAVLDHRCEDKEQYLTLYHIGDQAGTNDQVTAMAMGSNMTGRYLSSRAEKAWWQDLSEWEEKDVPAWA